MRRNFPGFACHVGQKELRCIGKIDPDPEGVDSTAYTVEIFYGKLPLVRIVDPYIEPRSEIHMYRSGNLCLYYPGDLKWHEGKNLHETIVPWTAEWLVLYEWFLHTGKWEGPEAPHRIDWQ
ncbi:hypothetical protein [Pelagicoccus sp. SDUM812002]|uniref:hypothetical protein n=1 Tax=Pelagicoccus sp. SDUM812002 TaxID=3041266 RepID=UPI002811D664|nr:hypothetical protein [Pelagicoccus sp. SDUM812002]